MPMTTTTTKAQMQRSLNKSKVNFLIIYPLLQESFVFQDFVQHLPPEIQTIIQRKIMFDSANYKSNLNREFTSFCNLHPKALKEQHIFLPSFSKTFRNSVLLMKDYYDIPLEDAVGIIPFQTKIRSRKRMQFFRPFNLGDRHIFQASTDFYQNRFTSVLFPPIKLPYSR